MRPQREPHRTWSRSAVLLAPDVRAAGDRRLDRHDARDRRRRRHDLVHDAVGRRHAKNLFTAFWNANASWELAALPLFIWMGEILFRTRLSEQMFTGLAPWLNRIPGG